MNERSFSFTSLLCRRSRTRKTDDSSSYISPFLFPFILLVGFIALSLWMVATTSLNPTSDLSITDPSSCPDYFRWIHEDLQPWKKSGITKEMVQRAKATASFRLVIIRGRVYVERYRKSYQTRDVFTIWGIIQLLRRYPGRIPDLDMMFDCEDWPRISKKEYAWKENTAPPLFRYCGDDLTLDLVFPDWSFWGWAEINVKPWDITLKEILEENQKIKWIDRDPHAYWKGNPYVAEKRQDLLKCNVSADHDWNARIYIQDWIGESQSGFQHSKLAQQCLHRYKIYIEGSAWSVSEKYILSCDSPTLLIKPLYYDFFSRGLFPLQHYWPIREDDKCRSIEFAVQWGNSHEQKPEQIGREASRFMAEQLSMERVYDYMFHLLTGYAKLQRFQPTRPKSAQEYSVDFMVNNASVNERTFMDDSLVRAPFEDEPCSLPPPFGARELDRLVRRKASSIQQVESWEAKSRSNG